MTSNSVIRVVLRECEEKLVDELHCDQVTEFLRGQGFISLEAKKAICMHKDPVMRIRALLTRLEESRNDDALEALISHLRQEGTQPHLWTLLEYSRVKHRRLRAKYLMTENVHM